MSALFLIIPLLIPLLLFLGLYNYLNSSGPKFFIFLIELPLIIAYVEKVKPDFLRIGRWGRYLRIPLYILLCTSFLVFIILIPENLYHAWLKLLAVGQPLGMVSFAFVYSSGIVSSMGCSSIILWKNRRQALLTLLLLINMVALILYPSLIVFLPFLILLILSQYFRLKGTSSIHRLFIISIISIPALLFTLIIPLKDEVPGGSIVVDQISWKIKNILTNIYPDFPIIMQIPGYGYSYDSSRKGGERPILSPNVIFKVKSPSSSVLYLRSDVFYVYSGNDWIPEKPEELSRTDRFPDLDNFSRTELTVQADIYTRIPMNENTQFIGLRGVFYRINSSGAYLPPDSLPLTRGDQVILLGRTRYRNVMDIQAHEKNKQQALYIPGDLKMDLLHLAESLKGISNIETLNNIKDYLANNFSYSLDTNASSQLILDFLFTIKRGYCVHFSSSAALLARTLGLPVRIAQGFLVNVSSEESYLDFQRFGEIAVTGYSAHQWPEIYIEERGWVPWEVTPPFLRFDDNPTDISLNTDPMTMIQLKRLGILGQEEDDQNKDRWLQFLQFSKKWYITFLLFLTTGVSAGVIFIILNRKSVKNIRRLINRMVVQKKKKLGVPLPSTSGWTIWFNRIYELYPKSANYIQELLPLILLFYYGPQTINPSERSRLLKIIHFMKRIK
jgi:transglutaminase-like putative cysteine protease